ncbi:MAG: 2OG-Fe(II) oxygenase [Betaproteobacteria bacterium]|nr:2OG-Fe(II) oxygenase [Betaproteobacteria bacterium]
MISEQLTVAAMQNTPFPHVAGELALEPALAKRVHDWLEQEAAWRLSRQSFYEQFELSLPVDAPIPTIAPITSQEWVTAMRQAIEHRFAVHLQETVSISAHKLMPGHRIGLHNDYIENGETHRLLIQLNPDWHDERGGFLLFFGSGNSNNVQKIYKPLFNSFVAFEISKQSFHAVTNIHQGIRYTLVYTFTAKTQ